LCGVSVVLWFNLSYPGLHICATLYYDNFTPSKVLLKLTLFGGASKSLIPIAFINYFGTFSIILLRLKGVKGNPNPNAYSCVRLSSLVFPILVSNERSVPVAFGCICICNECPVPSNQSTAEAN